MKTPQINAQACIPGDIRQDARTILKRTVILFITRTVTKPKELWKQSSSGSHRALEQLLGHMCY